MTIEEIRLLIRSPTYDFLRTNEHLKNIAFLTLGGSYSYGTNVETSDVDIRGCALNSAGDIIGLSTFEHVIDKPTDTTIYAFNKLITLLVNCNPNVIEMLGCKPEHYLYVSPIGKEMIDNRKMFLSQRAIRSFGGYAIAQLRRLENALARDRLSQPKREDHIRQSIEGAVYSNFKDLTNSLTFHIEPATHEGLEEEVCVDLNLCNYPVRDLRSLVNDIDNVVRDYERDVNSRNKKKDDAHLNKHAMHLVRLYYMCIDILTLGDIKTYRTREHELLMDIRNGHFQNEDGTFKPEFFDMVDNLQRSMEYAQKNTSLPKHPDMKKIEEFVMDVNKKVVNGNV